MSRPATGSAGLPARAARLIAQNRAFIIVWLSVFISLAGLGMVSPLLPKFAEEMGATGTWLGLIFSGYAFTQVPLMPVVGKMSDRYGKKIFIAVGLLLYALSAAGYWWAPGYREVFYFRLLAGAGAAMVIPVAYAYVGDLVPPGREGRYMGIFNIAMVAGYGLGPTLGGLIYDGYGMDATFISMMAITSLSLLVVVLFLPRDQRQAPRASMEDAGLPGAGLGGLVRDPIMRAIMVYMLVWGLAYGAVYTFLPIYMTDYVHASLAQVGIVLSVRSVLNGTLNYPYGWLADRFNRVALVMIGLLMMGGGVFLIPNVGGFAAILTLFAAIGILETVAMPAGNAITVETGRRLGMGSVMSLYNMSNSAMVVVGALVGSRIEGSFGISWVFQSAALAVAAGAVVFGLLMRRKRVRREA